MLGYLGQLENALAAINEVGMTKATEQDPSHIDVE